MLDVFTGSAIMAFVWAAAFQFLALPLCCVLMFINAVPAFIATRLRCSYNSLPLDGAISMIFADITGTFFLTSKRCLTVMHNDDR